MKTITMLNMLSAAIGGHLHELEEISLKDDAGKSDCCYPSYGSSAPSLYISGRKDSKVYDMPKEGTAKIKFRMRSKGVDYRENGEETYRTDIEVQSIEPVNLEAVLERYEFGKDQSTSVFSNLPDDWERRGHLVYKEPKGIFGKADIKSIPYAKAKKLGKAPTFEESVKQGEDGTIIYDDVSPSRVRRAKAVTVAAGAAGAGYIAGKHGKSIVGALKKGAARVTKFEAILEKYDFTDRARDTGGRFAPGMNVSAEDMDAAYGQKKKKRTAVLAGVGAAGLATAAVAGGKSGGLSQAAGRLLRSGM